MTDSPPSSTTGPSPATGRRSLVSDEARLEAREPGGRKRLRGHEGETPDERRARKEANRRARVRRRRRREPFLRIAVVVLGWLPIGLATRLGALVGRIAFHFARLARERVLAHLRIAFGDERSEKEIQQIARANFAMMGRSLFALPAFVRRGPEYLRDRLDASDQEVVRGVLESGAAVMLTQHFGLFDAAGLWLVRDWNGAVVGRDGAEIGPTRLVIDLRDRLGVTTIERGDPRAIVRALRDGRPVGMLADHDVEDLNGVFVPFFGKLAHTPLGPATLAIRSKVPVVPTVVEWTSWTTLRLRVLGVLHAREDLPRDRAAHELTARFTKLGEDAIRERPEHWIWIHKRWQTRREDRPDLPSWDPAVDA